VVHEGPSKAPFESLSSTARECIPCRGVYPEKSARVRPENPGAALRVAPWHLLLCFIFFLYSLEIFHSNKSIHSLHSIHRSNLGHRNLAKRAKKCEKVRKGAKKGIRALHAPNGHTQGMHGVYTRHAWPLPSRFSLSLLPGSRQVWHLMLLFRAGLGLDPVLPESSRSGT